VKAPLDGLRATLRAQPSSGHPSGSAGCTCLSPGGQRVAFDDCTCRWGELLRKLLYLGYGATQEEAVEHLAELGGAMNILATRRRREILQERLDAWPADQTIESFCQAHGITRARYDNLGLKRR
jgi:hypothetical protein